MKNKFSFLTSGYRDVTKNVASKVAETVTDQVSIKFSDLNVKMVGELKVLIIASIIKFDSLSKNKS